MPPAQQTSHTDSPATDTVVTLAAARYRLRAPLARSAYGIVWRAERHDGASVALKLVNAAQMAQAQPAQRARWIDSAASETAFLQSLSPWDERHIVRLLDSGMHAGLPVLALELLDGDLARYAAGRATGIEQALAWITQLNQALAKVHQAGRCHLDLKPANVLLHRDGGVRLGDFGTSRPAGVARGYAGTAGWQAPEQFFPAPDGSWIIDPRGDYFALGALLYFLVCGRQLRHGAACGEAFRQHGGAGAAQLLARHGGARPPILHADEAALFARHAAGNPAATALLCALLAPVPEERPGNALAISRMIAAIDTTAQRKAA